MNFFKIKYFHFTKFSLNSSLLAAIMFILCWTSRRFDGACRIYLENCINAIVSKKMKTVVHIITDLNTVVESTFPDTGRTAGRIPDNAYTN